MQLLQCAECHKKQWVYNCYLILIQTFALQNDIKAKADQACLAAKEFSDIFYEHFDKKRHVSTRSW
jgi:hypothetical protein